MKFSWVDDFILNVENIININDFVETAEEIKCWSKAELIEQGDLKIQTSSNLTISGKVDERLTPFEEKIYEAIKTVSKIYQDKFHYVPIMVDRGYVMSKLQAEEQYPAQVDNLLIDQKLMDRQITVIFTLDDKFNGGEIYFPVQKITLDPKPGSALIFPANFCYPYTHMPVLAGTKHIVRTWLSSQA